MDSAPDAAVARNCIGVVSMVEHVVARAEHVLARPMRREPARHRRPRLLRVKNIVLPVRIMMRENDVQTAGGTH